MSKIEVLHSELSNFARSARIRGKGPLAVMLTLSRKISGMDFPLNENDFITEKGGQVAGLGRGAVQSILHEHGITKVLAQEGGRTSRGSMSLMKAYIEFVNELKLKGLWNSKQVEKWWIERIQEHFSASPIRLRLDASRSLGSVISELLQLAQARQRENPGTMVGGAVLQHLVGAKLRVALSSQSIPCHGFSVADSPAGRDGDFMVGDTAIHVTTAPSEALLSKCVRNLEKSLRPLIITTQEGLGGARALARNMGVEERVDVLDVQQFVATNIFEWTGFQGHQRAGTFESLVDAYNHIIDECETDGSLRIELG